MFLYGDPLTMTGSDASSTEPAWEFYDLMTDPKEDHNLYGDKAYEAIINNMKKEMMKLRKETGDTDASSERMQEILSSQGLTM